MEYKVKLSSIDIVLLLLSIISINIVPQSAHFAQVFVEYLITGYIIFKYLSFDNIKHNKVIIVLLIIYAIVLSYSTNINIGIFNWTLAACMTVMQYLAMFLLFFDFSKTKGSKKLLKHLIVIISILLFLNDILMPIIEFHTSYPDALYLLGNKFSVSYMHCFFGALIYVYYGGKIRKRSCVIWFAFSAIISISVDCTTGIIIAIVMAIMILFPDNIKRITSFAIVFPVALCIENVLIWGTTSFFKLPWVINIMTNFFHKSADMTGRERLYNITLSLVLDKPLFGYGHNTDIYRNIFGYGNAQNGLFHIITQAGIIGAVVYFLMITYALINKRKDNYTYGLYMFVYAMLIGSAVEINLSVFFLLAVAVIYALQRSLDLK